MEEECGEVGLCEEALERGLAACGDKDGLLLKSIKLQARRPAAPVGPRPAAPGRARWSADPLEACWRCGTREAVETLAVGLNLNGGQRRLGVRA